MHVFLVAARRTNEKHNCWIYIYSFIRESMFSCTHIQCLHGKPLKPKLFDLLLIEAYSKGEDIFYDQLYNTNSQTTSNMLSNVNLLND